MRKRAIVLLAAAMLLLAGCGEKEESLDPRGSERLELLLDFFPNADHAGIYAAEAGGHFEDVGLDVRIQAPTDPAAPIKQVAAGRVDLAISYAPEVLRARDQGLRVVSVAALVQRPLTSIISLPKANIREPGDLEGKRVGTAGIDYQSEYLKAILERAAVEPEAVEERDVGFNLSPALLAGRVDAVLGSFWNYEGTDLRLRGKDPRIIRVDDAGIPRYDELVVVANEDSLEERGDSVRAFVGALARGTRDLQRNPRGALDGLLKANRDLDAKLQRAVVDVSLKEDIFLPPKGRPYGYHEPAEWEGFTRFLRERKVLERLADAREAYTNDYLPGQGL
jgi:putative hydroxymethylpyrimidine transport system substrate-binding protein